MIYLFVMKILEMKFIKTIQLISQNIQSFLLGEKSDGSFHSALSRRWRAFSDNSSMIFTVNEDSELLYLSDVVCAAESVVKASS